MAKACTFYQKVNLAHNCAYCSFSNILIGYGVQSQGYGGGFASAGGGPMRGGSAGVGGGYRQSPYSGGINAGRGGRGGGGGRGSNRGGY